MGEEGLAAAIEGLKGDLEAAPAAQGEQLALLPAAEPEKRGPGRPPGAVNKATIAWNDYLRTKYRDPKETLMALQHKDPKDLARELGCKTQEAAAIVIRAAEALMPYMHRKLLPEMPSDDGRKPVLIIDGNAEVIAAYSGGNGGDDAEEVPLVPVQQNQAVSGDQRAQSDGGQSDEGGQGADVAGK